MRPAILVHGGAWDWADALDAPKREDLIKATQQGWDALQAGGSALDAVEQAVNWLEDAPLFDAGTGSHLNADGIVEMDALIVDGAARNFGAVAGVQRVRYPISLARKVLQETEQNMFVGAGADALAARLRMPLVPNMALVTDYELDAFRRGDTSGSVDTVGAVAIDAEGNIAVATSTGGTPAKPAGRVGDSPLFGAGGYADNAFGGAGATGQGEHAMRTLITKYAVDQIMAGMDAQAAAEAAMRYVDTFFERSMLGIIVVDKQGRLGAAHTTPKLSIGWIDENGNARASLRGGLQREPSHAAD